MTVMASAKQSAGHTGISDQRLPHAKQRCPMIQLAIRMHVFDLFWVPIE